jgi:hypothetical protein
MFGERPPLYYAATDNNLNSALVYRNARCFICVLFVRKQSTVIADSMKKLYNDTSYTIRQDRIRPNYGKQYKDNDIHLDN